MRFAAVHIVALWSLAGILVGVDLVPARTVTQRAPSTLGEAGSSTLGDAGSSASGSAVSSKAALAKQATRWTEGAPSKIKRAEGEGAAIGHRLYLFGGYSYPLNGWSPYSRVDVYDVAGDRWTRLSDLPRPVNHAGVAVDGQSVYLAGGYVANTARNGAIYGTREVWKYDSATDSYSAMPPLPVERAAGALVLLGRRLHFFGGTNLQRTRDTNEHWALDLDGDTGWQPRAPMLNGRNHLGAVALGGMIYAIGGQHGHDKALITQRDVEVYDPQSDSWTALAPLPALVVSGKSYGRGHISGATFVRDGKIVVAGGEYRHMQPIRDIVEFDPQANNWKALTPLPASRRSGVARQFGDKLIYATGATDGSVYTNTTLIGVR